MNLYEYQKLAFRTICDQSLALERINSMNGVDGVMLLHGFVGLSAEVGELGTALEHYVWYRKPFDKLNAQEEIGDCLWRLAELCTALGVSLEDVAKANIKKLEKRFPTKFDLQKVLEENRDREAEQRAMNAILDPDAPNYEKDNHA